MTKPAPAERPPLHLLDSEADTLANLAMTIEHSQPRVSALLFGEIDRAEIHTPTTLPRNVVTMNSYVTFADEGSGGTHEIQLVYPGEADIQQSRISVLTLVGAGLIGLSEGQSITWPDREGHERRLRIERVRQSGAETSDAA